MKKASIALVLILAVVLVSGMACDIIEDTESTPTPTPTTTPTPTSTPTRGEQYRESEAIASVHSRLYGLAESQEAHWYVAELVEDYYWGAEYRPWSLCNEDEECWHVENIVGCATCASWAHWFIYGSDMNQIVPGDDAIGIEAGIKALNVDPNADAPRMELD